MSESVTPYITLYSNHYHDASFCLVNAMLFQFKGRCTDFRETAETISKSGFRLFLNMTPTVVNWSPSGDAFSLLLDPNPLTEFVELPDDKHKLNYSNILCGVIRGALEMVGQTQKLLVWYTYLCIWSYS